MGVIQWEDVGFTAPRYQFDLPLVIDRLDEPKLVNDVEVRIAFRGGRCQPGTGAGSRALFLFAKNDSVALLVRGGGHFAFSEKEW